jgi:hypothetical protein
VTGARCTCNVCCSTISSKKGTVRENVTSSHRIVLKLAVSAFVTAICCAAAPLSGAQLPRSLITAGAGAVRITRLADFTGTLDLPPTFEQEPFTADVRPEDGTAYALSAERTIWRSARLRLGVGAARTRLHAEARFTGDTLFKVSIRDAGQVTTWSGAAEVILPLLRWRGLSLFSGAGVGAQHWQIRQLDSLVVLSNEGVIASIRPVNATTVAATVAAGLDVQLGASIGLRLELLDQIAADPLDDQDFAFSSVIAGTAHPADAVHTTRVTAALTVRLR